MKEAYIISGLRSPVGKAKKGGLRFVRPDDLAATIIKKLVERVDGLEGGMVDDLIVGNAVPEAEQGMQMARYISLLSLPKEVPGLVINRYCGSGLEAIHLACAKINSGSADCVIAGGTESMSMVPMTGYKSALNYNISQNNPEYYLNMGLTAEKLALEYDIKREDSDLFSLNSHKKATKALEKKLRNNTFTFEDFLSQIQKIKKMGNLKDLIGMMPGVSSKVKDLDVDDESFKPIESIIYSMTPSERKNPDILNGSRKKRIADGSGTSVQEINQLVKQFTQMKKMMKMMKKSGPSGMMSALGLKDK